MSAPVSVNNSNNSSQPLGAFGLGNSKKPEAGSFVLNPPKEVYKYSIYDELELGQQRYKKILGEVESKSAVAVRKKRIKKDMIIQKIINWTLIVTAGVLAYKYRSPLKTFFTNVFNRLTKRT